MQADCNIHRMFMFAHIWSSFPQKHRMKLFAGVLFGYSSIPSSQLCPLGCRRPEFILEYLQKPDLYYLLFHQMRGKFLFRLDPTCLCRFCFSPIYSWIFFCMFAEQPIPTSTITRMVSERPTLVKSILIPEPLNSSPIENSIKAWSLFFSAHFLQETSSLISVYFELQWY